MIFGRMKGLWIFINNNDSSYTEGSKMLIVNILDPSVVYKNSLSHLHRRYNMCMQKQIMCSEI